MNTKELNEFIKHYLEKDKTQSAILLTAPWGTGKSYYIQNELIPYIDTDNQKRCVVVSLYGLKDLFEVSKSIYLDVRAKMLSSKSEKVNAGKILAKTILKGVTSFFGIDLSTSQKDLLRLYESIDLTGKLIILEDLERSGIDILEIMGYVNNLVEQDGVKVLLVANENEILKYNNVKITNNDGKTSTKDVLTKESEQYLQIKEKTVSDTILFSCPLCQAIENIIRSFRNKYFDSFLDEENTESSFIDELKYNIIFNPRINNCNLRSFTFACQKIDEIFRVVDVECNVDYLKYIFLSVTAFVLRKKQNDNLNWDSDDNYSQELGTYQYPLAHFCYNYIVNHTLDKDALMITEKQYCAQKETDNQLTAARTELRTLYNYMYCTEADVLKAINNIAKYLEKNSILLYEYGKLANYLFAVEADVGKSSDIERCKAAILKNLEGASEEIIDLIAFHSGIEIGDAEQKAAFLEFKKSMTEIANVRTKSYFDFDYSTENLDKFCDYVHKNISKFLNNKTFATKLNTEKFTELLSKCNAQQIDEIRGAFKSVYQFSNANEYFSQDKNSLIVLQKGIKVLLDNTQKLDKIQKLQLKYFMENLDEFISNL